MWSPARPVRTPCRISGAGAFSGSVKKASNGPPESARWAQVLKWIGRRGEIWYIDTTIFRKEGSVIATAMSPFKTRPHRFAIGYAPTSRARCRVCKNRIEAGSSRFTVCASVRPGRVTNFHRHLVCASAKLITDAVRVAGGLDCVSVDGVLTDNECRTLRGEFADRVVVVSTDRGWLVGRRAVS